MKGLEDGEVILNFLCGPNAYMRVLIRRQKDQLVVGDMTAEGRSWRYVRKGLGVKQQRQALED